MLSVFHPQNKSESTGRDVEEKTSWQAEWWENNKGILIIGTPKLLCLAETIKQWFYWLRLIEQAFNVIAQNAMENINAKCFNQYNTTATYNH